MELPPFLHHLPRYVTPPHHHHHHPSFSDERNSHRHHHLPPPPPPPIPHTQSYRPLPPPPPPPPPPYNPDQSQFTFLNHRNPVEYNPRRPHYFDSSYRRSPPPRVSDRIQFDDFTRDSRPGAWADPPRVLPESRREIDLESSYHRRPYETADKYRREIEGSSVFRNDFVGRFERNHADELLRGGRIHNYGNDKDGYRSNYSEPARKFEFDEPHVVSSSNLSRELGLNLGNYGSSFCSIPDSESEKIWINRDENRRWGHDRPPSRESPNRQFEVEDNDFSNRDSTRGDSVRRVSHAYDSGRFVGRGSRENNQESACSPRKKIQRKSALLRIQHAKPSNRIRNVEQHFSSAYFDDSDTSSFRGKDLLLHSEHRMEEDREVSPVQLDVSFKSNSLVAKPIVAPNGIVSDRNLTPRHRKIRRVLVQETDLSNSPGPSDTDSSAHVLDYVSNSYRKLKGSQPCSKGTSDSPENIAMKGLDSDVGGNTVDSSGPPSLSIRKKKKIVTPLSRISCSLPKEKFGDPINADSFSSCLFAASRLEEETTHSEEKITTNLLENGNLNESPQATVSEEDGGDADSGRSSSPNTKRKRTSPTPVLDLSSPSGTKSDEGTVNTKKSPVHDLHTIPNFDKGLIELHNGSISSEIGMEVNQQSFQNELAELFDNHFVKGSLEAAPLAEGNNDVDLSSAEESKVPKNLANLNSYLLAENNASSFHNESTRGREEPNVANVDVVNAENRILEGFPNTIPSVGGFAIVDSSTAEEPKVHKDIVSSDYTPHVKRKRKFKNTQSGLSSPRLRDTSQKSPSTSGVHVNEVSSTDLINDLIFAEKEVVTSTCSQPCKDSLDISVGLNGTSPKSRKKRQKNVEVPLSDDKGLLESETKVAEPSNKTLVSADLPPCTKLSPVMLENSVAEGSFEAVGFNDNASELEKETHCPSGSEGEPKENANPVMAKNNYESDIIEVETGSRGETFETAQCGLHLETQALDLDLRQSTADIECNSCLLEEGDLHSLSDILTPCEIATNSRDEPMESVPDTPYKVGSPKTLSIDSESHVLNAEVSLSQTSYEVSGYDRKDEKRVPSGGSVSVALNTSSNDPKTNRRSDLGSADSINAMTVANLSQDTKSTSKSLNLMSEKLNMTNNQTNSFVHYNSSKKTPPLSQTVKSRTWHRTGNPSPPLPMKNSYLPQTQSMGKIGKVQSNSYVRKGNSLVRNPSPVASRPYGSNFPSSSVYRLNPLSVDQLKKSTGFQEKERGGFNVIVERPRTPPLPHNIKLSNCTTISSNGCSDSSSGPSKFTENMDVPKESSENAPKSSETPESQTALTNNLGIESLQAEGNTETAEITKIVYVKRKLNQLVAASSSSDVEKTPTLASDAYYKRRQNQLIRKSLASHIKERAAVPDSSLRLEGQRSLKFPQSRSSSKRRSVKGIAKTSGSSKFSWVRTLCETLPSKKDNFVQNKMVWPQLFPWKRATHWRSFMHNSACTLNISSLSNISRKLLFSRKRDTIYTRSARGFSLRRSKVLSVGGSSLKWSKSIERDSRKANEEATLAVAAAEKKKKEQNSAAMKSRNNSSRKLVRSIKLQPGARIFRIGSVRYKMDSTRRTLQRISDEESPSSAALKSGRDAKKSYVPRRLVIGDDEYVRIGNGNQLVRDPKRRTRRLASEKVRWSLHTARLRLARKRKYCQFFTRFGKCNKDGGKCPYIHDPSKIAVCTKFLSGACSNPNCKLTHKIIPERMPDCSYFLQGICSNESCPYRHVNVNRNAPICEGFLRGYCADGNECRNKHSYVCPAYEATGVCPQGSKCKLHHPKNRTKGKKRKPSRGSKNTQGRYFGSRHIEIAECITSVSEKHSAMDNDDIFFQEGRFTDFISLNSSDEEAGETSDQISERTSVCDDDPFDVQVEDLDELIKPMLIFTRSVVTESSPAIDSPSERTASYISEESYQL